MPDKEDIRTLSDGAKRGRLGPGSKLSFSNLATLPANEGDGGKKKKPPIVKERRGASEVIQRVGAYPSGRQRRPSASRRQASARTDDYITKPPRHYLGLYASVIDEKVYASAPHFLELQQSNRASTKASRRRIMPNSTDAGGGKKRCVLSPHSERVRLSQMLEDMM